MAYDKNRGRAAGTPSFYKTVGQKHTHGENTGEWTREQRARHEEGDFKPRAPKGGERFDAPKDFKRDDRRPARTDNRGHYEHGGAPVRGTRNRSVSPDRPIYQDAFEGAPEFERRPAPARAQRFDERRPAPARAQSFDEHRPAPLREPHFEERRPAPMREPRFDEHRPAPMPAPRFEERRPAPVPPMPAPQDPELIENIIVGRNPIREAVKNGRELERILVQRGELSGSAREIVAKARERHIVVQEVDKARLDAIYPNHQGMIAYASAASYSTVDDMFADAEAKGEKPFLIVLDGITDPHNLGAIIRTAECVGAHGVIIQQRRSVGLTPAAVKAAAGAAEYMKVAKVVNITRTLAELKERGVWVIGADMDGQKLSETDLTGATALVIGAEGEGISRLVKDECDLTVALPMRGHIDSLNASVAAGVLMYAVRTARGD